MNEINRQYKIGVIIRFIVEEAEPDEIKQVYQFIDDIRTMKEG
jgi:hypothetical protein